MPKPGTALERQSWSLLPRVALALNRQKRWALSELPPHSNATGVGVLLSCVLWCHVVGSNWKYVLFSSCLNKSYQAKRILITGLYMQIYLESCPTTHWIQQMSPNKSKKWAFNPISNNPDNLAMTPIGALQTWLQGSNKKGWEEPSSFLGSVCVQWHLTDHKWPHALRSSQLELNARLWSSSLATARQNPETAFLPRRAHCWLQSLGMPPCLCAPCQRPGQTKHSHRGAVSRGRAGATQEHWFGSGFESRHRRLVDKSLNVCVFHTGFIFL